MATKSITGNYLICENEVFVEGESIGQFVSCSVRESRRQINSTCDLTIPFFSVAVKSTNTPEQTELKRVGENLNIYRRVLTDEMNVRVGAMIEVVAKYRDNPVLGQEFEPVTIFKGYIREIVVGFPTRIKCEDMSFPLRFGDVNKSWLNGTKLKDMLNGLVAIGNNAFAEWRKAQGFTRDFTRVSVYDPVDTQVAFKTAYRVSPYGAIEQMICRECKFFAHTNNDAQLWVGYRSEFDSNDISDIPKLSTAINVISRDIVPKDNLFENFRVVVKFNMNKGEVSSYETGSSNGIPYELPYQGTGKSEAQMKQLAKATLDGLKAEKNKGTIKTLLYPQVPLYSLVDYVDTIDSKLSDTYFVVGRRMECNNSGYRQTLEVTNKKFIYD